MSIISIPASAWERGLKPTEIGWHAIVHVLGCAGVARFILVPNCYTALLTAVLFLLGHLSIRTGAHSLYTHRAYEAAWVWHLYKIGCFFLTMQGPLSVWVRLHVRHHKFTDQPEDPYSPAHGFLWSHMLWRCFNLPEFNDAREAVWLVRGATPREKCVARLIAWQQRWAWSGGLLAAVALPTALASLWGDAWGGLLVAGFFRLLCQYHLTWQINSLGHTVGTRPHSPDSSRNAPWWLSPFTGLLSVGEATRHNRHHRFPRDLRIGNRVHDNDAGKWELYGAWVFSRGLRFVGLPPLVWDLHLYGDDGRLRLLR